MLSAGEDLAAVQKLLPQLSVPLVMLHGEKDPLVPVENVAWLEQQLASIGKTNLFVKIVHRITTISFHGSIRKLLRKLLHIAHAEVAGAFKAMKSTSF